MTIAAGSRLGPYEILSPLGAGGMGEVYRARDTRLGREVAVKVLPAALNQDPERLRRFEQEARAASALNHPNILTIHDFGMQDGAPFVVSELLEGETLRERMAGGALPTRRAVDYARQVAQGLAAAHEKGIVHRDLKPENLFVTKDGHVKILDFGLAKLIATSSEELSELPTAAPLETAPGVVLGTVGYMSPEQASGKPVDFRSDQFSFGAALYEMVSGRRAFLRPTAVETLAAIVREEPPPLDAVGVPEPLRWIIERCLAKDPRERYDSTRDLARDLDRAGENASTPGEARPTRPRWRGPAIAAVMVLLLAAIAALLVVSSRAHSPRGGITSLAVLPFANAGSDPESDYLSDGITDSLIDQLSRLPGVKVISHASVFRYRNRAVDPRTVGRELGVEAVLAGSIVKRGNDLAIGAELVDARDERHIWGERYRRRFSDIFAMQTELAREIADNLKLRLSGQERTRLSKNSTESPEAYQLYLKGRYLWNKRTPENLIKARDYFEQAIGKDPTYGLAYSGLSDTYAALGHTQYGVERPNEAFPKARSAALQAIKIDDGLAEAHASMGNIAEFYDWNWAEAEKEYRRAIALNPNYGSAHHWLAILLASLKRFDESLAEIRRAQEVDPLSLPINSSAGWMLFKARRYDEGLELCRKTLEMDPNFVGTHYVLGLLEGAKGRLSEALEEFRKADDASGGNLVMRASLGFALGQAGHREEAEKILRELGDLGERRYVPASHLALVSMGLGRKAAACEWLGKALENREAHLTYISSDPSFDLLRAEPCFQEVVRRVGLPS